MKTIFNSEIQIIYTDKGIGSSNCFLIKVTNGFILVDTGGCTIFNLDKSISRNKLEKELSSAGCFPGNLKLIILTHGHTDHIGNALYFREKYKTKLAMNSNDIDHAVKKPEIPPKTYKSIAGNLLVLFYGSNWKKMNNEFETFIPDLSIDESFDLTQYGLDAKVLWIPGHTKGSIGILTKNKDLLCGDALVNILGPRTIAGKNTVDDLDDLTISIERLKKMNIGMVYTAHGKPFLMSEYSKN